jgi:hypothetical protein
MRWEYSKNKSTNSNNTRARPLEAVEQTAMVDDFIIQTDFDFGA